MRFEGKTTCWWCKSEKVLKDDMKIPHDTIGEIDCVCDDCGATWTEMWEITYIEDDNMEEPPKIKR